MMVIFTSRKHQSHSCAVLLFTDLPIVASFPHFYARSGKFADKLEGLKPDADKHTSYTIIEPVLGVPLHQRAVSQSNMVTRNMRSFKSDIAIFSDMVIPMFWFEYVRKSLISISSVTDLNNFFL